MKKKYLEKGVYSRTKTENYWWSRITIIIMIIIIIIIIIIIVIIVIIIIIIIVIIIIINWVEINHESRETYSESNQIKFKTSMVWSNLCVYSDAYILVSWPIKITGAGDNDATKRADERNKGAIFKNCAPFTDWTSNVKILKLIMQNI